MAQQRERGVVRVARSRYWREADARLVIESWRRSGRPLAAFARRYGLKPRRIARWVSRLEKAVAEVRFHPVRVVDAGKRGGDASRPEAIEVVLVGGHRVRLPAGFAAEELRRVLAVLEGDGRC